MGLLVFDSFAEWNAWWLRFVFLTVAMVALAGRSRLELAETGGSSLADLADDVPWLKVWAGIWVAIILLAAIVITRQSMDLFSLGMLRVIIIPLAIVIAPFVVLNERRKFIELGKLDDAI